MKIYILIINYKTEDLIGDAVRSFKEENVDTHIIILDNGSTEESYKALKNAIGEEVEVIRNEKNLGYSAGANHMAEYMKKTYDDAEYIFFFNPDAIATENMLGILYKTLSTYPNAAAVSPLLYDMDGEIEFNGMEIDWKGCKIHNISHDLENPNKMREIDSFHGCAVLIDANKFFEVGMFNEDLFIYYDEPFLSMEFKEKGYICLYEPSTEVYHHGSQSSGNDSPFKNHLLTRNHIMFFKKYGTSKRFLCVYLKPLRMVVFYLKRLNFKSIQAIGIGIIDGLRGKTGAP